MSTPQGVGLLANSVSNLVVGAATMGYTVLVPAMVLRRFGTDEYGMWFLAFQIAAYVLLLDLGSQTVVSKEAADPAGRAGAAQLTSAAMASQLGLALVVVGVAAAWAGLADQRALAPLVTVLGAAAASSLLASTVRAWYGGLQRSHVAAAWLVVARLSGVAGLCVALAADAGLVALTAAVAGPQLLVHGAFLLWARRPPSPWARPDRAAFRRLVHSSSPLALWTIAGVFIAGVDIFVVRAVDPAQLGEYAIALPLLAVPTGIVTAAMSAWIPWVATVDAERPEGGRDATFEATAFTAVALSLGAVVYIGYADELVGLWAGTDSTAATGYLRLLYLAWCLRIAFLPWSVLVLVRSQQRLITFAPVTEAAVNLAASIVLGLWLGAVGVAIGTVAGAVVAAAVYLTLAIPRTAGSGVTTPLVVRALGAAWPPLLAAAFLAALSVTGAPAAWRAPAAIACIGLAGWWTATRRRMAPAPSS